MIWFIHWTPIYHVSFSLHVGPNLLDFPWVETMHQELSGLAPNNNTSWLLFVSQTHISQVTSKKQQLHLWDFEMYELICAGPNFGNQPNSCSWHKAPEVFGKMSSQNHRSHPIQGKWVKFKVGNSVICLHCFKERSFNCHMISCKLIILEVD